MIRKWGCHGRVGEERRGKGKGKLRRMAGEWDRDCRGRGGDDGVW